MTVLSLEEKVAQLFFVGSDENPVEELEPFFRTGLGGFLLFRHHLQPFSASQDVRDWLRNFSTGFRGGGLGAIGIDQEGGQVERLPYWLFPSGVLPVAMAQTENPGFCESVHREISRRLRWLGITVNFVPTVDLNTERLNPIIGVRAFGTTPHEVLPFARGVINSHREAGVLAVAKHFPGHGAGTVDSHVALPVFANWSEVELRPYEQLIREGLDAVLVAHGLYPRLARDLGENPDQPASLSYDITTRLLRERLGFNGLVFTDDLMMGAVWGERDPVEVALAALKAGADQLVYRRAQPEAFEAYQAVLSRVRNGKLSENWLDEKLTRLFTIREKLHQIPEPAFSDADWARGSIEEIALSWAQTGLTERKHTYLSPLPLSHHTRWALVAPDLSRQRHYAPDQADESSFLKWCRHYGLSPAESIFYSPESMEPFPPLHERPDKALEVIVFVAFNSILSEPQQALYRSFRTHFPDAKIILASGAMPTDADVLPDPWIHVQLPNLRPAGLQAFFQWLITSPGNFEKPATR